MNIRKCALVNSPQSLKNWPLLKMLIASGDLPEIVFYDNTDRQHHDIVRQEKWYHYHTVAMHTLRGKFAWQDMNERSKVKESMFALVGPPASGRSFSALEFVWRWEHAVLDMRGITKRAFFELKTKDIVDYILATPPMLIILIDADKNSGEMRPMLHELAKQNTRMHHRLILLKTEDPTHLPVQGCICYPGSVQDKVKVACWQAPPHLVEKNSIADKRREVFMDMVKPIVEKMRDFTVYVTHKEEFEEMRKNPKLTAEEFTQKLAWLSAITQKRQDKAQDSDDYPTFEASWRNKLPEALSTMLSPPPITTSSSTHKAIPMGTASGDAFTSVCQAIRENDVKPPYAVSLHKAASADKSGMIEIVQPHQRNIVHITVNINVDGTSMVQEQFKEVRQAMVMGAKEMQALKESNEELRGNIQTLEKSNTALRDNIQTINNKLDVLISSGSDSRKRKKCETNKTENQEKEVEEEQPICSKPKCNKHVQERFANGNYKSQCQGCRQHAIDSKEKTTLWP